MADRNNKAEWAAEFPPGCGCERIDVSTSADGAGTQFIRGRSDPPCSVHLPRERALYNAAYARGYQMGYSDKENYRPFKIRVLR